MPNNDLPGTPDTTRGPGCASDAPQNTTAPERGASAETTTGLDLRGYELQERLGGGGMGDVYRAGDPALGRDLAVKVMKTDMQGHAAAERRFLREARVTGSLQHPGIVPIHNLGRLSDGRLHYTMRLVRGRTLADILHEEAGQPERLPALLTIFEKLCQAVAYAHSKRVLHRDLKPANVMVGRFGEVQVMDWGLAKLLTAGEESTTVEEARETEGTRIYTESGETPPELTRLGREMGTPAYMPPEQALGEWDNVDERADVFALGAILCEILTGRPPYRGGDRGEVLRKAKRGDLAEALARLENCSADAALLGLCRECLAMAQEERPRDAEQVAQRVAAYQAEVQERLRRAELERAAAVVQASWERKKRRWILAGALLLLVGAAISTWLAVWAKEAEGRAREKEALALTAADAERAAKRQAEHAAESERKAKDLAQKRLGQIEKANEVLTSIFRDLDPRAEEKGGPSLRRQLSHHLQRAATQLNEAAVGDAEAVARLQAELGLSLMNLGQTKLAIELLSKAIRTLEAALGLDHPDTLATRNNLAVAYESAGRIDEAIRLNEQNLKQREAKLGADHLDTLNSRNSLATALHFAGRTAEAIPHFEQILKQREAKLGIDHPDTLASRNNLAVAYRSAGRLTEAIPLFEQTLKQREYKLGTDHPDTLQARNNLATAYGSVGRTEEAVRLLEQNLQLREAKLGPDHPHTLSSMANLGAAYRETGRLQKAIVLFETALQRGRRRAGGMPALLAWVPGILADTYEKTDQFAKAESIYRELLKQAQHQFGPDDPRTAGALNQLGANLLKQKRYRDAEPLLLQGQQAMNQHPDKIPPIRLREALERLVRLYEATGQKDKAAGWRKKLDEVKAAQKKTKT